MCEVDNSYINRFAAVVLSTARMQPASWPGTVNEDDKQRGQKAVHQWEKVSSRTLFLCLLGNALPIIPFMKLGGRGRAAGGGLFVLWPYRCSANDSFIADIVSVRRTF